MNWKAFLWILATIICDICAISFGYITLWILGFFLTLVLLIAFIFILCSYWMLSFEQKLLQSAVERHTEATLAVTCKNSGFLLFHNAKLHCFPKKKQKITIYPGEQEFFIRYIFHTKGKYAVGVKRITVYEPFGIFCRRIRIRNLETLYVLPRVLPMRKKSLATAGRDTDLGNKKKNTEDRNMVSDLREYEYGDTLNSINWKATAKRNQVIVNQYENTFCVNGFVYVDRFQKTENQNLAVALENFACDIAATKIKELIDNEGLATVFYSGKNEILESGAIKSFQEVGFYLAESGNEQDEMLESVLFQKDIYSCAIFVLEEMTPRIQKMITLLENQHVYVEAYQVKQPTRAVLLTGQKGAEKHA